MSLKAHILLGTLLGVGLGVGAVAVLSDSSDPTESVEGRDRMSGEDADASPTTLSDISIESDLRRPLRPGALRRSAQS